MSSPWECVCEFIRSQSANLQNVLESLGNQQTLSDIDTSDTLQLSSGVNPLHMFMFLLLAVWGFLYLNGRQRTTEATKPAGGGGGPSQSSGGAGGSSSSGSGGGGSSGGGGTGVGGAPPDSGELY
eukprot:CAMPEP_0183419386 /NCGR_PEP_ID=MMETSP0370-20130417/25752_1 /TAXON_ID=268820 /ORGANISM="Peridinium aciculiferum, Strain PAER-2" /LENGTH=124 /DNA_ID=CAMNT_0025603179 /DNA_START=94 /DNA_END=468 /DNA_ORIENTATION=+